MTWQYNRPLSKEELDVLAVIESDPSFGMDKVDFCLLEDGPHVQAQSLTSGSGERWFGVPIGRVEGVEADKDGTTHRGDA